MPIFKYRAKKGPSDITEGRIEVDSLEEAIERLSRMGYIPIQIKPESKTSEVQVRSLGDLSRRKVKSSEITIFSREMASLLKSGVPILTALNIILEQSENDKLRDILRNIFNAIKNGATFSSVLGQYPRVFSSLYIAMIQTGENSGALPEALLRIADYRARQEEMVSRFRMALAYPVLMAIVGLLTVVFMLTFVMPRLMGIFANIGQDLPLPTQILIAISQTLRQWWLWIVLGLIAFVLVFKKQAGTKTGRVSLSLFKLHLPLFGKFILKAELSRFNRTLELLIKNGIPILKAIDIAIPVVQNEIIKNKLLESRKELEKGGSFGRSLKNSKLFPLFMSNLIIVGEESGNLDGALAEVANVYERDTDETIRIMSSLLEPLMILGMGLIVGFMVISMLLPIFEINVMAR